MPRTNHKQTNKLFWPLSLGTLGVALLVQVFSLLMLKDRLPDPLATHWNGSGIADGTGSFTGFLWLSIGTLIFMGLLIPLSSLSTPKKSAGTGQPWLAGIGNGLLVGITGLFLSGLIGQLDAPNALGTTMNNQVLVLGVIGGVLWGLLSAFLVQKAFSTANCEELPATEKSAGTSDAPSTYVPLPGTRIASSVNSPLWLSLVLLVTVAGAIYLILSTDMDGPIAWFIAAPGLLLLVLASLLLISGKVVTDDEGIRVYGGGIFKLMHVRPNKIKAAEAREIRPMEYGGWGLRISGAGLAFITGTGPGVVVTQTQGADRIYSVASMDDAQAMASILNRLAAQNTSAGSST